MGALDRALNGFHTQCGSGSNQSADVCMQLASQLAQTGAQVLLPCVGPVSDQPVQFHAEWIAKKRALQQDPADQDKDWVVRLATCSISPAVSRPCSSRTRVLALILHKPFLALGHTCLHPSHLYPFAVSCPFFQRQGLGCANVLDVPAMSRRCSWKTHASAPLAAAPFLALGDPCLHPSHLYSFAISCPHLYARPPARPARPLSFLPRHTSACASSPFLPPHVSSPLCARLCCFFSLFSTCPCACLRAALKPIPLALNHIRACVLFLLLVLLALLPLTFPHLFALPPAPLGWGH
jgi:hypothetical protein